MPPAKKQTPREWLELIREMAGDLRDAGVTAVRLEGCSISLAPKVVTFEEPGGKSAKDDDPWGDPLSDPTTFGLPPDARAPSFPRADAPDDDEDLL